MLESYSMVSLYIRYHGGLGFPSQNITQTPASQYHPSVLAVLVRYNQAQNLYVPSVGPQMFPIDCHKIKKKYSIEFSTD